MENQNDLLLISLIASNDQAAFKIIVKKYWHNIYCHSLTYIKSAPQAEEITQDIFMRLWDNRSKLHEIENFENYLFILSRNYIVSALRKKIHPSSQLNEDIAIDLGSLPDHQTEYKEIYELFQKAIELLPAKRKEVFKLSRLEGKTHEEISIQLGIHKDTVSQYIVKALIFLKSYMFEATGNTILLLILYMID
jgi:RNA polymerase sigma-70 factor (ECF subfamily)